MATRNPTTRSDFYVYALFRSDGRVFYIGKGRNRRWAYHEEEAKRGRKGHRFSIIREMLARGVEMPAVKLHEGLTEAVAHNYEIALIKAVGRHPHGPLVNITAGGDGVSGLKFSQETLARMAATRRGKKFSDKARANVSAAHRNSKVVMDHIARVSKANLGRKMSASAVAKSVAARRGKKRSSEQRARMSAGRLGMKLSPEHRANISAGNLGKKASPEARANMKAAQRKLDKKLTQEQIARRTATRRINSGGKYGASNRLVLPL
jgi:hypothetical protein